MRRVLALLLGGFVLVAASPAYANDRDVYERTLGTPPTQLQPKGLLGHSWRGVGTGISGGAVVSNGELVLDDRPFDDTGADTRPGNGPGVQSGVDAATLSGLCTYASSYSTGDFSYPSGDAYRANSADLVQVRLAVQGERLHVLWQLETLVSKATTAVALLLDTDRNATTGSAAGFAGFDAVLDVEGSAGTLNGKAVPVAVDLASNTVEAVVPLSSLPHGPWRVNAVAGSLPVTTTPTLTDAVYVVDEPVAGATACKLDAVQSARLASRRLDGVLVDPLRLARGGSDPLPLRRGAFTRNYVPTLKLGEGLVGQDRYGQSSTARIYRGTVQPYSVYVPSSYDPRKKNPIILLLHCLDCWYTVFDVADLPIELAEKRGALIVTPFAYGEGGHYELEAQKDVFEVLSDVSRRYSVDQDRLYLTGMSMGALGTYRLGGLFPDMWARMLAVESYTTPFCVTPTPSMPACSVPFNYLDLFPNYRDVPVGITQGALDELTPVTGGREFADLLTSYHYPFRYWEWPNRTHDPKMHGLTTDVTSPFLGNSRREESPAAVTYVQDRAMRTPGEVYDRAYWLSRMHLADGARIGRVDAVSGRGTAYSTRPVFGSGTDDAGSWTMRGLDAVAGRPSGKNSLTLTLSAIDALTVDVARARLSRTEPLVVAAKTDRAAVLHLGGFAVHLPAGSSRTTVPPRGSAAPAAMSPVPSGTLPTTGGGPGLAAFGMMLMALVVRWAAARDSR
ncbi:MAG: prolyl oligopeptidase family protein [Frankiales bacterium]|nr:prolyl oligopeptidase family protein [Frankiales bacterium]